MAVSSCALMWAQPTGPGAGVALVGVLFVARSLPLRPALALSGTALVVLAVTTEIITHGHGGTSIPMLISLVALVGLIYLTEQLRQANDHAERLLTELEASRAVEARAVGLAERQRLAREMHDVLAHSLSGLLLKLEGARMLAARDHADPRLPGSIDDAHRLARSGLEEARRAIGALRGEQMPGPGRLPELAARFGHDQGIPCRLTVGAGMTRPIRVLVADDQKVVREGLVMVLGMLDDVEVVGTASDGTDAVAMAAALRPDIVLMDLRMPRCDGVEATRLLRARQPEIKVVVLTTYADDRSVIEALRAGARGYLTKDAGGEEIHHGLMQVFKDRAVIDPAVQHYLLDAISAGNTPPPAQDPPPGGGDAELPDGLTPREAEVLALIAGGLSNAEIAARLVVTEGTVKSHINHLLPKIGARDRAQAVSYAYQHGLAQ